MNNIIIDTEKKIESGFKTPDGYFENFSNKLDFLTSKEKTKVISFYSKNKKWIYSVAAVIVLALTTPLFYKMQNNEQELTSTEIENYLTQEKSISDDEIVDLLEKEDIEKLKVNHNISSSDIEEELTSNNDIENYIINEN